MVWGDVLSTSYDDRVHLTMMILLSLCFLVQILDSAVGSALGILTMSYSQEHCLAVIWVDLGEVAHVLLLSDLFALIL